MSITFTFKGMPTVKEELTCLNCCDGEWCPHCSGTGVDVVDMPICEVNWSNGNTVSMLKLFCLENYYGAGVIPPSEFPQILSACIRLLNTSDMNFLAKEGSVEGRVYYCGSSRESWVQRAKDFQKLVLAAKNARQEIYFG